MRKRIRKRATRLQIMQRCSRPQCRAGATGRLSRPRVRDDGSLRQEFEKLLDADAAAGSFLRHPVFDLATADDGHGSQDTIGPYTLLEIIGQGGMGEVGWPSRGNRYAGE